MVGTSYWVLRFFYAVWVLTIAMVFLGRVLIRGIQKKLRGYGYGLTRVAIIGKTKSAEALKDWFLSLPSYGFSPVLQLVGFDSQSQQELLVLKSQGKLDAILLANPEANKDEVKALKWFTEVENLGFYYLAELLPGGHLRPNVHTFAGRPVIELPVTPLDGHGRAVGAQKLCVAFTLGNARLVIGPQRKL